MKPEEIVAVLDTHFPNPKIPLFFKDPYTLLIAVLLSAQCTDERVNQIAPMLFTLADTPEKMVHLSPDEIEEIIRPCGLSNVKSKAIWNLSRDLIDHHAASVPNTFENLEKLPGVGHKTASVVMSGAFSIPAFPIDTHIHRCAERWGLSTGTSVKKTEEDLKKAFPKSSWNKLHLQIIYFARKFCPARGHKKEVCPICSTLC